MLTAQRVLDDYFLDTRCMLIEIAATLDRYDRAVAHSEDSCAEDFRLRVIYDALTLLAQRDLPPERSRRLLDLFSEPCD